MSKVINTKRVVVAPNGEEYDNPSAFARHERQTALGHAFTRIRIKRSDEPMHRLPEPDFIED